MSVIDFIRRDFGGRGGRGLENNNNDDRKKASTKKTIQDLIFYYGSAKQSRNYKR